MSPKVKTVPGIVPSSLDTYDESTNESADDTYEDRHYEAPRIVSRHDVSLPSKPAMRPTTIQVMMPIFLLCDERMSTLGRVPTRQADRNLVAGIRVRYLVERVPLSYV